MWLFSHSRGSHIPSSGIVMVMVCEFHEGIKLEPAVHCNNASSMVDKENSFVWGEFLLYKDITLYFRNLLWYKENSCCTMEDFLVQGNFLFNKENYPEVGKLWHKWNSFYAKGFLLCKTNPYQEKFLLCKESLPIIKISPTAIWKFQCTEVTCSWLFAIWPFYQQSCGCNHQTIPCVCAIVLRARQPVNQLRQCQEIYSVRLSAYVV